MSNQRSRAWRLGILALALCSGDGGPYSQEVRAESPEESVPKKEDSLKDIEDSSQKSWDQVKAVFHEERIQRLAEQFPEFEGETVGLNEAAETIRECIVNESRGSCTNWDYAPPAFHCYRSNEDELIVYWVITKQSHDFQVNFKSSVQYEKEAVMETDSLSFDPDLFPGEAARICLELSSLTRKNWMDLEKEDDENDDWLGSTPNYKYDFLEREHDATKLMRELNSQHGIDVTQSGGNLAYELDDRRTLYYQSWGVWPFGTKFQPWVVTHDAEGEVSGFQRKGTMYPEDILVHIQHHL